MKSLSILCQKGGVGKTTIVVNIAKIYSNNGIKTLIVDLDPQGNTSTYLDFDKQKNMRSVRASRFHPFSRPDLCHVSEN